MTNVLVTGGSGKLGRAVLKDLIANGYQVLNVDQAPPPEPIPCQTVRIDLTDYGQVLGRYWAASTSGADRSTRSSTSPPSRRRASSPTPAPSATTCP
jgi:nucleoside-diphosphate-sugar epimerase